MQISILQFSLFFFNILPFFHVLIGLSVHHYLYTGRKNKFLKVHNLKQKNKKHVQNKISDITIWDDLPTMNKQAIVNIK